MNTKHKAAIIFCLVLLGVLDAAFLSSQYMGGDLSGVCGPATGCGAVLSSKYSHLFGIPLAYFGLGMYVLLAVLAYFSATADNGRVGFVLIDRIALTGTVVSAALMFAQAFILKAFCPFCTISALTIALVWIFSGSVRKSLLIREPQAAGSRGRLLTYGSYGAVVLLFGALVFTWIHASSGSDQIVARVGQVILTEPQMNEGLKMAVSESEGELYEAKLSWIDRRISEIVLQTEAEKRKVSLDSLLSYEVNAHVSVADSEVVSYYKLHYKNPPDPIPKAKENIRHFLLLQKRGTRKNAFADSLKVVYQPEILLKPPETAVFNINVEGSQSLGPKEAPVTIVIFTDFQCPFCAQIAANIHELENLYGGKIRIVIKHFPLSIHKDAELAAQAAECAGEQGKFWQYHDMLFANQDKLDRQSLIAYASRAGLNVDEFERCLESDKCKDVILRDKRAGEKIGVSGTPTVFFDGRVVLGNLSLERMKQEIDLAISHRPSSN